MSNELFEVVFRGEILAGENSEDVRARVGKLFNADEKKLTQLFSGNRVVIKKNIDEPTAAKYRAALNKAGAVCEIRSMDSVQPTAEPAAEKPATTQTPQSPPAEIDYGEVAPPPQTDPLGITADQIEDLSVSIAPVGSVLQDEISEPEAPQIDISGFEVAPVGSTIGSQKKEPDPPPPDTTGLSLAD